jgi:hypothetical protein
MGSDRALSYTVVITNYLRTIPFEGSCRQISLRSFFPVSSWRQSDFLNICKMKSCKHTEIARVCVLIHRLKRYGRKLLRRIFRPKGTLLIRWRKFIEEHRLLYSLPNIMTIKDEMGRTCSTSREWGLLYQVGRRRWVREHNIKTISRYKVFVDWIEVAQDRIEWRDFVEHGNGHSTSMKAGNSLTSWVTVRCT